MPLRDTAKTPAAYKAAVEALVDRLAAMPLPTEDLRSTWNPPDWEDIVDWYDGLVKEARELSPKRYRE